MIKEKRSWWKDDAIPNLIGRKQVDYSIFAHGTHIPMEFHEDFMAANKSEMVPSELSHKVNLIIDDHTFDATMNIFKRKSADKYASQIRYDNNMGIKDLLKLRFHSSFKYITQKRTMSEKSKEQIKVPEAYAEYIEFYATDKPYEYELKFYTNETPIVEATPNVWWVNQGTSYATQRQEGILWAPLKSTNGRAQYHWETLTEVRQGDIILHYSKGAIRAVSQVKEAAVEQLKSDSLSSTTWEETGRLIETEYHDLSPAIPLEVISQDVMRLGITQGPMNRIGGVIQGYLFRFSAQALFIVQNKSKDTPWPEFTLLLEEVEENDEVELVQLEEEEIKSYLTQVNQYIQQQGFTYPTHLIENFYLSLKTKPFVILAGISGTGKTKLVQKFAEAVGATEENKQFTLIPVRPDWNDPSDLIGYKDLSNVFRPGKLTDVLLEASVPENVNKPYFICLDEMNLARVEHYFSDLLSILETQRWQDDRIVTDTVVSEDNVGRSLGVPDNVFFIGTVNMDETTHPFSKKVLDRANTIEFNYIELNNFSGLEEAEGNEEIDIPSPDFTFLRSDFIQMKDAYASYKQVITSTTEELVVINEILEDIHAHVGFRVRDAICFYMIYNQRFSLMSSTEAMDFQLLQKLLPRIQGNSQAVKSVLIKLMLLCVVNKSNADTYMDDTSELYKLRRSMVKENTMIKYPHAAKKIEYMLRRLEEDGFTSFWIS